MAWYKFLYQSLHNIEITLPEGVQAIFVLDAANESEEKEKPARTMCTALINYSH